jgi:hypothetical protein
VKPESLTRDTSFFSQYSPNGEHGRIGQEAALRWSEQDSKSFPILIEVLIRTPCQFAEEFFPSDKRNAVAIFAADVLLNPTPLFWANGPVRNADANVSVQK